MFIIRENVPNDITCRVAPLVQGPTSQCLRRHGGQLTPYDRCLDSSAMYGDNNQVNIWILHWDRDKMAAIAQRVFSN